MNSLTNLEQYFIPTPSKDIHTEVLPSDSIPNAHRIKDILNLLLRIEKKFPKNEWRIIYKRIDSRMTFAVTEVHRPLLIKMLHHQHVGIYAVEYNGNSVFAGQKIVVVNHILNNPQYLG